MKFIITPASKADLSECIALGLKDIFVDFERRTSPDGIKNRAPNDFSVVAELREHFKDAIIYIRPDGEDIHDNLYLNGLIDLQPDCVFFPNAEDTSQIEYLSGLFAQKGAQFISMVESPKGFEVLRNILQLKSVYGVYLGLHDFSKSIHASTVFETAQQGYLDQLAKHARNAGKPFGFTTISSSFTNNMIISLMQRHAKLGSEMMLASTTRLKQVENNDIKQSIAKLMHVYNDVLKYD